MKKDDVDLDRRRFLTTATSVIGGVGMLYTMVPFIAAWNPSAKAQAAGAPVEADLSRIEVGQQITVSWRNKPVWIVHRSKAMLDSLKNITERLRDPQSNESSQPQYAKNVFRARQPTYLIVLGLCTHLGCVPIYHPQPGELSDDWPGGFYCPCHGSSYDLSGRVYKGVPAPLNLPIPPYRFISERVVQIGEDEGGSA